MSNVRSWSRPTRSLIGGGLSVLLLFAALQAFSHSKTVSAAHTAIDGRIAGGSVVIAGGGYVSAEIRQRFLELAGGSEARIVVIPAVDPALGTEDSWLDPWREIGATHVELCHATDRAMANSARFCAALTRATGVWISGGYQDFLAARYVDTAVQKCMQDVLHRNGVVGGCSAGAAILSRVMIQQGEDLPIESRGLDLVPDVVIDQHFLQRNRLWRMQQMLESHPQLVGMGVDENTALIFEDRNQRLSVLGDSYALVCIPPQGTHSSRTEVLHAGDNVLLTQLRKSHLAYQPPTKTKPAPVQAIVAHAA